MVELNQQRVRRLALFVAVVLATAVTLTFGICACKRCCKPSESGGASGPGGNPSQKTRAKVPMDASSDPSFESSKTTASSDFAGMHDKDEFKSDGHSDEDDTLSSGSDEMMDTTNENLENHNVPEEKNKATNSGPQPIDLQSDIPAHQQTPTTKADVVIDAAKDSAVIDATKDSVITDATKDSVIDAKQPFQDRTNNDIVQPAEKVTNASKSGESQAKIKKPSKNEHKAEKKNRGKRHRKQKENESPHATHKGAQAEHSKVKKAKLERSNTKTAGTITTGNDGPSRKSSVTIETQTPSEVQAGGANFPQRSMSGIFSMQNLLGAGAGTNLDAADCNGLLILSDGTKNPISTDALSGALGFYLSPYQPGGAVIQVAGYEIKRVGDYIGPKPENHEKEPIPPVNVVADGINASQLADAEVSKIEADVVDFYDESIGIISNPSVSVTKLNVPVVPQPPITSAASATAGVENSFHTSDSSYVHVVNDTANPSDESCIFVQTDISEDQSYYVNVSCKESDSNKVVEQVKELLDELVSKVVEQVESVPKQAGEVEKQVENTATNQMEVDGANQAPVVDNNQPKTDIKNQTEIATEDHKAGGDKTQTDCVKNQTGGTKNQASGTKNQADENNTSDRDGAAISSSFEGKIPTAKVSMNMSHVSATDKLVSPFGSTPAISEAGFQTFDYSDPSFVISIEVIHGPDVKTAPNPNSVNDYLMDQVFVARQAEPKAQAANESPKKDDEEDEEMLSELEGYSPDGISYSALKRWEHGRKFSVISNRIEIGANHGTVSEGRATEEPRLGFAHDVAVGTGSVCEQFALLYQVEGPKTLEEAKAMLRNPAFRLFHPVAKKPKIVPNFPLKKFPSYVVEKLRPRKRMPYEPKENFPNECNNAASNGANSKAGAQDDQQAHVSRPHSAPEFPSATDAPAADNK